MDTLAHDIKTQVTTATILYNNLIKVLADTRACQAQLEEALIPFAIIQRNKDIIQNIGIGRLNRVFGRLKRSSIPKRTLKSVIDHFHTALADKGAVIPPEFMEWRDIIAKYPLNTLTSYAAWIPIIRFMIASRLPTPRDLGALSLAEVNSLLKETPWEELIAAIWQSSRIEFHPQSEVNKISLKFRNNNLTLVEALRSASRPDSAFASELSQSKEDLGLPIAFEKLGPAAKINALRQATPDSQQLLRFCVGRGSVEYTRTGTGYDGFSRFGSELLPIFLRPTWYRSFSAERHYCGAMERYILARENLLAIFRTPK